MAVVRPELLTSWNPEALGEFSDSAALAEQRGNPLTIDLTDQTLAGGASPAALRLFVPSVMVVANLLMGRFRDLDVVVKVPQSRGLNLQLARGGLFFALSNRTQLSWQDVPDRWDRLSTAWAHPFHPSDEHMCRDALVTPHDVRRDSWLVRAAFQRYLLSIVHPHRRPAPTLHDDLQRIVRRWLSTRLNVSQGKELVSTIVDCGELLYEIVVNVPDHARLGSDPAGCSLGQMYATLGGGRDSHNRLHFSVIDNGVGMLDRVNAKFTDRVRSAEEAIRDAVMGELPRRAGGRGVGLSRVREITEHYTTSKREAGGASNIRVITSGDRPGSAAEFTWGSGEELATSTLDNVPVVGTVVWVTLGLEQRTLAEAPDQLELTFAESATV